MINNTYYKYNWHCQILQNEEDSVPMFDRELLKDIDLSEGECRLHECGLSVDNPGDNLVLRPLCTDDYDKGKSAFLQPQASH